MEVKSHIELKEIREVSDILESVKKLEELRDLVNEIEKRISRKVRKEEMNKAQEGVYKSIVKTIDNIREMLETTLYEVNKIVISDVYSKSDKVMLYQTKIKGLNSILVPEMGELLVYTPDLLNCNIINPIELMFLNERKENIERSKFKN